MDANHSNPFNQLPPVVIALAAILGGLEILFQLATAGMLGGQDGVGWRLGAIQNYAVLDQVWEWMRANNTYPGQELIRFVTYPFIHSGFVHVAFVVVFILALGKMVAEVFSAAAFLAVFWLSALVGGLAFVLLLDSRFPLIGGYPGVYGLIGAFSFLQWVSLGVNGGNQYRAFGLIVALLAIQLIFAVLQGFYGDVVADLSGFVTGFLLSFLVSPGGWHRLLVKLRQR
ncbi:rhomboid family intramembrane serine protease [Rhodobacteraceae bacterium W635]|uniref:rhomboid family intramembrane serine protease n=1 Tax=Nioella halotolerans TaxID=2303578 RepID=UPI000E3C2AF7|nr:rhomboid family intramembrane serine protease [Rhodobacteraceae bacterium W635]